MKKAIRFSVEALWSETMQDESLLEAVCSQSEDLMESYLNDEYLAFSELSSVMKFAVSTHDIIPLLYGSAKNDVGISELLDTITNYLPVAQAEIQQNLSAIVYKIDHDKILGRVASVRIFSGVLKGKSQIYNATQKQNDKSGIIRKKQVKEFQDLSELKAGDSGLVYGFEITQVGDILGEFPENFQPIKLNTPLLTVQVVPENEADYPTLLKSVQQLADEDPSLQLEWLPDERELHIKVMGEIQIEILQHTLKSRFQIDAAFKEPTVIYKETPSKMGEGFVRYWMPKPCWAIMTFKIEPAELGSGVQYSSIVPTSKIEKKYQKDVERTIPKALKQGIKGWEVTDLK